MIRLVLALSLAFALPAVACDMPAKASALSRDMVEWINRARAGKGLGPLAPNAALNAAAQTQACDMATRGYFAHQRKGGPDLAKRVKSQGYNFRAVAENLAATSAQDAAHTGEMWRNSAGHWKNITNRQVNEVGIGIAVAGGKTLWVMVAGAQ